MKAKYFTQRIIKHSLNWAFALFILVAFSNHTFSQPSVITLNKTVTPKTANCGQFDVLLSITGNPPARPIDVIIVIDRSGSMDGSPLTYAKQAAQNFASNVIGASNPYRTNRVGIVSYSSSAVLDLGLTSNLTDINNAINAIAAAGSTNIQDGFVKAENELNANAAHDCETIRAIVLLTDGVANATTSCSLGAVQCAINAGVDAQFCDSGEGCSSYGDAWVYTIGLFGGISGGDQTTAQSTLIACQNGGYWFTETAADLDGIYDEIYGDLVWAAKAVSGQSLVVETVGADFSIIGGPLANEGSAVTAGQVISWNLAAVYGETATLTYTIQSNNTSNCGNTSASTSQIHYVNVSCAEVTEYFPNPTFCVPCLTVTADAEVSVSSCCAFDYSVSASETTSCASGETFSYAWEFYDVTAMESLGSSSSATGTFTVPDCTNRFAHTFRATPTVTFHNGSVCSMAEQAGSIEFIFSNNSPSTADAGPDQSICSDGSATLAANVPAAGTGSWSVTSGPSTSSAQFSSVSNHAATFTPAGGAGSYVLKWTIANPPCTDSSDEVTITVKPAPSCSITGNNGPLCPSSSNTYSAPAGMDTYSWSVTGNGSISGSTSTQTVTVVAGTNCNASFTLNLTVTDDGCTSTCQKVVSVLDNTAPTGSAPAGTSGINACYVSATTPPAGTPAFNAATAAAGYTDNCGGTVSAVLTNTAVTGNNCAWTVTYTFKVVDPCNNELTGQTIQHTGGDKTAPTGTAPDGTSGINACYVSATTPPAGTPAFNATTAAAGYTDNCGGTVSAVLTNTAVTGNNCAWMVTYTFKVVDPCNNELTGQTIQHTGGDKTAPTGSAPAGTSGINACYVSATTPPAGTPAFNAATAAAGYTDNCGGTVTAVLTNTAVTGNNCAWTVTYTFKVVDPCNNELTGQTIQHTGGDKTAPTGSAPAGTSGINACYVSATTPPAGTPAFNPTTAAAGYTDNCGGTVTAVLTNMVITGNDCAWTVTYTFKVVDLCNNELTGQTIQHTGGDKTPPDMQLTPTCVYLTEYGKWTLVEDDLKNLTKDITDNCSDLSELLFTINPRSFDCNDAGKNNNVTVTATDLCNNTSTAVGTVLVLDTIRPVALCKDITVYLDVFDQAYVLQTDVNLKNGRASLPVWAVTFNDQDGGSYDNCSISEMYLSKQLFTSADTGKNTVFLTVYDPSRNIDVCSAVVTVIDTFKSVLEPVDPIVVTVPPGTCTKKIQYPVIKIKGNLNVTLEKVAGLGATGDFPLGTTLETWKATDDKGNISFASFAVTVNTYNASPVMNDVGDITVNEDADAFEVPLSGIGYGNDCKNQHLLLEMLNSNQGLLMAELTFVGGSSTGKLLITPQANKIGEAVITLTLKDDGGTTNGGIDTLVKTFKITVKPVNDSPVVIPIPDQTIVLPGTLSLNVLSAFTDYDVGDVLTLTLTRLDGTALPAWMSYNPATGILSGVPAAANAGMTEVKATATDQSGAAVLDVFIVTVVDPNAVILRIKGKVVRKTGTPDLITQGLDPVSTPASGIVIVVKQNGILVANTVTGLDGSYEFTILAAGEYDVFAEVPGYTQNFTQKATVSNASPVKEKVDFTIWTATNSKVITNVQYVENQFAFTLYPNPATGVVNIDLTWNDIRKADVTVYSILGVQVFRRQYEAGEQITFDMSRMVSGIYMVKLNVEGQSLVKKLILDRK